MKSLIKLTLALLLSSLPFTAYANWGIGVTGGSWKMDAAEYKKDAKYMTTVPFDSYSGKITQEALNTDINLFFETSPKSGLSYGLSAGYGKDAGVKLEERFSFSGTNGTRKIENTTTAIPVSFYIKTRSGDKPYAFFGGAGFDLLSLKTTYKMDFFGSTNSGVFKKSQMVPNITAGGEYFLSKNFSAGLNLKYLFSAKVKDLRGNVDGVKSKLIMTDNEYVSYIDASAPLASNERLLAYDYSGLRINLAVRYYFGASQADAAPARKAAPSKPKRPSYLDEEVQEEPALLKKDSVGDSQKTDAQSLEQQKLDLEKQKLQLEKDKFEFEKQKQKEK